jgi:hypothetical protein
LGDDRAAGVNIWSAVTRHRFKIFGFLENRQRQGARHHGHKLKHARHVANLEEEMTMTQRFPPGWDDSRVKDFIAQYDAQSEDDQSAEIAAAFDEENVTMMAVPTELVPEVRALLARKKSA